MSYGIFMQCMSKPKQTLMELLSIGGKTWNLEQQITQNSFDCMIHGKGIAFVLGHMFADEYSVIWLLTIEYNVP